MYSILGNSTEQQRDRDSTLFFTKGQGFNTILYKGTGTQLYSLHLFWADFLVIWELVLFWEGHRKQQGGCHASREGLVIIQEGTQVLPSTLTFAYCKGCASQKNLENELLKIISKHVEPSFGYTSPACLVVTIPCLLSNVKNTSHLITYTLSHFMFSPGRLLGFGLLLLGISWCHHLHILLSFLLIPSASRVSRPVLPLHWIGKERRELSTAGFACGMVLMDYADRCPPWKLVPGYFLSPEPPKSNGTLVGL